jgi:hypothetical protein
MTGIAPIPGYQAGACNIGPDEITMRRRMGHVGVVLTAVLLGVLVVIGAPPAWRLLIALPAAGTAITYLQAVNRFCVNFGWRGVFNFGRVGAVETVTDAAARRADRARALRMILTGSVIGLALGVLAAIV